MPKISELANNAALDGTEVIPMEQSGATVGTTLAEVSLAFSNQTITAAASRTLTLGYAAANFTIQTFGGGTSIRIDGNDNALDAYISFSTDDAAFYSRPTLDGGGWKLEGVLNTNALTVANTLTPTGSDDTAGETGAIAWDEDFIYVKTAAGWASSPLTLLDPTP